MIPIETAFPLMRAGGFFLIGASLFFALARLDDQRWQIWMSVGFMAGVAGAFLGLALAPSLGRPSGWHWASLGVGFAIEIVGIVWATRRYADDERRADLAILFIVGLHFLPMAYGIGPSIAVLGILCMMLAALAWSRPGWSTQTVGLADAGLKFVFGVGLALWHPIAWPISFASWS
jgi:hypothetical protein